MSDLSFSVSSLIGLGRVTAIAPHEAGVVSAVAVERLDTDKARYVSDLWLVPNDTSRATRLTHGDTRDRRPAWVGETVLFLSDRKVAGEDEPRTQVWALPNKGEPYQVTREPLGVSDFRVASGVLVLLMDELPGVALDAQAKTSKDRKKFGPSALHYKQQPVRFWDHWLGPEEPRLVAFDLLDTAIGLETSNRRALTPDAGEALRECDWDLSADGRRVAITWSTPGVDRVPNKALAVIDTTDGRRVLMGAAEGVVNATPRFSPDGERIAVSRYQRKTDGYARRTLWRYDRSTDGEHELTASWDRWPSACGWLGEDIVVMVEERGTVPLYRVDSKTGEATPLGPREDSWEAVECIQSTSTSLAGPELVGIRSGLLRPPEPVALMNGELLLLDRLSGFEPELETAIGNVVEEDLEVDGRPVHTFVVEPKKGNGLTILWIHGGPVAAWGHRWHWRWSALLMAAQGFRVVLPNPAGSTGYGADWVDDIWGNTWGGRCYEDLMGVIKHLEDRGISTPAQTIIMGGSFGGYMTNWIGSQTDRFGLLVTHASLFSLSAFHGVTDMPSWWELMMGETPWSGGDYDRYSPSRGVHRWRTPTLILHGEKDYRVPIGEGLALFEALQRHGVDSELVVFPDEHHWIMKPRNIESWYTTVLDFIGRRLLTV